MTPFLTLSVNLLRRITKGRTDLLMVGLHLISAAGCFLLAFLLRFDFEVPLTLQSFVGITLLPVMAFKVTGLYVAGIYRIAWAYVGIRDLPRVVLGASFGTAFAALMDSMFFPYENIPRSIIIVDALLWFLLVAASLVLLRWIQERVNLKATPLPLSAEPLLVVGAGDGGEGVLRELLRNPRSGFQAVGFLDDDPAKKGRRIHGIPVLGSVEEAGAVAQARSVRKTLIAMPSVTGAALRRIVETLLKAGLSVRVLPPTSPTEAGRSMLNQIRSIDIEDLLRRDPVRFDNESVRGLLTGKTVLVTGAAGSIGSEICRQALAYDPAHLVLVDRGETPLFLVDRELAERHPRTRFSAHVADVLDAARLREVFERHDPAVVFHAAAMKHVPMMEANPAEAVKVNVLGTRNIVDVAREAGVPHLVMISTDKAVRPSSIMGATKRIAEQVASSRGYVSVRFGNVLGSSGSVIPIFKEQIAHGGPVTVTHPEMRRYFMTIPEAVQLVLQAGSFGRGGEVFVLDMGEPVRIVDLATDLIRLAGLTPGTDIRIEFTGVRPGEKLFEELRIDGESVGPTPHPKIGRMTGSGSSPADVHRVVERLEAAVTEESADPAGIARLIAEAVPDFRTASTESALPTAEELKR